MRDDNFLTHTFLFNFAALIVELKACNLSKSPLKIEASTAGSTGQIRIVDQISMFSESSSERVRAIVDDFIAKQIADTEVYINTRGGSVFEAREITNELNRLPKVTLKIGALAASAGTFPMTKFKSRGYSNSQFMIHRPRLTVSGDVEAIKGELKMLEAVTQEYKEAYAAKMGKTEEEIEAMFAKGDYWMTAKEAKAEGLLDEIISEEQKLTAQDKELLVACAAPVIPNIENQNQDHTMKNRNQIIAKLGLAADATDEQIESAVALAAKKAAEVDNLRTAQAANAKKDAEALVDKAILDKKITADVKEKYVSLAEKDIDSTKAILEAMPVISKASSGLDHGAAADTTGRENWTMEDYLEKAPSALNEMMANEPAKFEKLQASYFGEQ